MKCSRLFLLVLLALLNLGTGCASAAPALLTQDQAITRAKEFCAALGESPNWEGVKVLLGPLIAPVPASNSHVPSWQQTYWQQCYHLTLLDDVQITMAASTGVISEYRAHGLVDNIAAAQMPPAPTISEKKAIHFAAAAIQATGQKDELVFWRAQRRESDQDVWIVRWRRAIHGIPYHDQRTSVVLQATTGAVVLMALRYPTPPYTGDLGYLPVSRSKAVKAAADYCVANHISLPFVSAHLEIVQPNSSLAGMKPLAEVGMSSHAAWVCSYTDAETFVDVWIDARTSALLGGEIAQRDSPIQ